jgi:pyruvate-formate lyase-activating enzyme
MKLEDIGFYTLSDARADGVNATSRLMRCELILTDACNFKCPYCRGPKHKREAFMPYEQASGLVIGWAEAGLFAIRFSGGEPTLYPQLPALVALASALGIEHVAVSTNGSADRTLYKKLVDLGVNDFSISLDAFDRETAKRMAGGVDAFDKVIANIKYLSERTYVTVGMVFTEETMYQAREAVEFAASLGVSDIRVLSSAQFDGALEGLVDLPDVFLNDYPILKYRVENFRVGRNVRGLRAGDTSACPLVLDDQAVAGDKHFPCIIYLREGGDPIGTVGPNMRTERTKWFVRHDTGLDPICSRNCLDVCVDYNNRSMDKGVVRRGYLSGAGGHPKRADKTGVTL